MEKNDKIDANLFDKIQNIIKYLRINAVNIINQISKVREISSYYEMRGKWDPDKANKAYLYNNNYLLNMRKNIKFINNSILFNYLETDNGIKKTDIFFSNIKSIINKENTKISIPISIELKSAINKCKYIILQDDFFSNIQKENNCIKQRNILSPKAKYKNNLLPRASSEIYLANENDNKKYMTMFGHNKINLSRTLYYLKKTMGNNYEKMFMNQKKKNRQLNLKKDLDIMDKFFPINKQNSNYGNNNMNIYTNNDNNNKIIIEHTTDAKEEDNYNNKKIILEHINADSDRNTIKKDKDKLKESQRNIAKENEKLKSQEIEKEKQINAENNNNYNELKDKSIAKKDEKGENCTKNSLKNSQVKNTEKSETKININASKNLNNSKNMNITNSKIITNSKNVSKNIEQEFNDNSNYNEKENNIEYNESKSNRYKEEKANTNNSRKSEQNNSKSKENQNDKKNIVVESNNDDNIIIDYNFNNSKDNNPINVNGVDQNPINNSKVNGNENIKNDNIEESIVNINNNYKDNDNDIINYKSNDKINPNNKNDNIINTDINNENKDDKKNDSNDDTYKIHSEINNNTNEEKNSLKNENETNKEDNNVYNNELEDNIKMDKDKDQQERHQ